MERCITNPRNSLPPPRLAGLSSPQSQSSSPYRYVSSGFFLSPPYVCDYDRHLLILSLIIFFLAWWMHTTRSPSLTRCPHVQLIPSVTSHPQVWLVPTLTLCPHVWLIPTLTSCPFTSAHLPPLQSQVVCYDCISWFINPFNWRGTLHFLPPKHWVLSPGLLMS